MSEKFDEYLDQFLEMGIPGYDCMICMNGKEIYRRKAGYADRENKIPVMGNELYNIFSCSKPVTCVAALQLWEKGLYQLDDELCKYMPEFSDMMVKLDDGTLVPAKQKITIRHLFTMTAGLTYDVFSDNLRQGCKDTNGKCPTREMVKYLAKDPLAFHPGEKFRYSLCHDVLVAFVEVISGMNFNDYVTEHIFKPLGMSDSSFLYQEEDFRTRNFAQLYRYVKKGDSFEIEHRPYDSLDFENNYNNLRWGPLHASGGAGCVTTVEDYMRFLNAWCKGDVLLKQSTTDMMLTNQLTPEAAEEMYFVQKYHGHGYGLGVRCPLPGETWHIDSGWGGAAGAFLAIDPIHQFTMFYAQHVIGHAEVQHRRYDMFDVARKSFGF